MIISILSAIALFFIIFAMGAIILLARRMAILTDDLRSLVDILKSKVPPVVDKVTETTEEARAILSNIKKLSDVTQNIQTLLLSSRKFAYYAGVFLAGLRTGLKLFLKLRKKMEKEADESGRK